MAYNNVGIRLDVRNISLVMPSGCVQNLMHHRQRSSHKATTRLATTLFKNFTKFFLSLLNLLLTHAPFLYSKQIFAEYPNSISTFIVCQPQWLALLAHQPVS